MKEVAQLFKVFVFSVVSLVKEKGQQLLVSALQEWLTYLAVSCGH